MSRPWIEKLFSLRQPVGQSWAQVLAGTCIMGIGFLWFIATTGAAEERFISPVVLPSPGEVIGSIKSLVTERDLLSSVLATMGRVLMGFGLAIVIAVPLGIVAGSWRAIEAFLKPIVTAGRNLPVAALIPLTVLWFGIYEEQKIMFIFIASAPFVFADASAAILGVHERYVDTARTLGASDKQIVLKVLVPLAMPDIFRSLRSLFGLAFGYIMLAELINAPQGLGAMLNVSQRRGLTEHIFLILLVIGLLAWSIDYSLGWLEKKLFPYRH